MKTCSYCQQEKCGCGAASYTEPVEDRYSEGSPSFYNGYIVWSIYDRWRNTCSWYFYAGDRLVETITLAREVYDRFVPENTDGMSFIWDLFNVAQGEGEILRIMGMNQQRPAQFEIRLIQPPGDAWAQSLTRQDLHTAIRSGERELVYKE